MNLAQLWQLALMILSAGAAMESLQAGAALHTADAGIPPGVYHLARRPTV